MCVSISLDQLNELFRKSEVQKDFMSVRVRSLAPSNSILAFVEAHFDSGNTEQDSFGRIYGKKKSWVQWSKVHKGIQI